MKSLERSLQIPLYRLRGICTISNASQKVGDMVLRMIEYDFAIAIEHSVMDKGIIEIDFPESCVLYLRNHRDMPAHHIARIRFADGQTVTYKVPVIMAQDYTVDSIF